MYTTLPLNHFHVILPGPWLLWSLFRLSQQYELFLTFDEDCHIDVATHLYALDQLLYLAGAGHKDALEDYQFQ